MSRATLYQESDKDRWVVEEKDPIRSCFRRDYARLIHSPVFRRLQGKTQLFPGFESDFFRNRLTHSLEVAQVAKSIAQRLNSTVAEFKDNFINEDIVEFAGLAHDLGHPPFGHHGERALDQCMRRFGGFEGNAQTLRNLRLEKRTIRREADFDAKHCGVSGTGKDFRAGLNLTARSLAAVLKYDVLIPLERPSVEELKKLAKESGKEAEIKVEKGYYECDKDLVDWVKKTVLPIDRISRDMKTIECQIMDLADDIAYSTYDLEDAFKAGFLSPLGLLALDVPTRAAIASKVEEVVGEPFKADDVLGILMDCFGHIVAPVDGDGDCDVAAIALEADSPETKADSPETKADKLRWLKLKHSVFAHQASESVASNGYARNATTSDLVSKAVAGIEVTYDADCPLLSTVRLSKDLLRRVETLKRIAHRAIVQSPRLRVAEYRGFQIVKDIFTALADEDGHQLLPGDYKDLYHRFSKNEIARHRLICDFIAGMTDAYAIEFYTRLKSVDAHLLFKPH